MLIQFNIVSVCVYIINEFQLFGVFVVGLSILSFCSNIKSTMETQSFNICLCETIESTSTNRKNNVFAIPYTICDADEATTVTDRSGINNNGDDRRHVAKKNKNELIRKLVDTKSVLAISEDRDEAYQIYRHLINDNDHVHHATYTSNFDNIHNNTFDLHFGVCGTTWNNSNNPNQSAACGNGGIANKVKSGNDDTVVMDRQLTQSSKVYVEYIEWLMFLLKQSSTIKV